MRWTGLRRAPMPDEVRGAIGADPPLGWASDRRTGRVVVAGTRQVYAVGSGGEVHLAKAWHLVDSGTWDRDTATLSVTFVDRHPGQRWTFDLDSEFPVVFRARVQASVVLAETVDLGDQRTARVVVRKDLGDQSLLTQAVLGPGVRSSDPGVRPLLDAAVLRLREQVGLD